MFWFMIERDHILLFSRLNGGYWKAIKEITGCCVLRNEHDFSESLIN